MASDPSIDSIGLGLFTVQSWNRWRWYDWLFLPRIWKTDTDENDCCL